MCEGVFKGKAELEYHSSWILAKTDKEALNYYRWWVWRKTGVWVMQPRGGAHISVVRGREERDPVSFLFEHQRKNLSISIHYSNKIEFHNAGYVWMPCWGVGLNDVREECGLPRSPIMPFHITIGRSDLLIGRNI